MLRVYCDTGGYDKRLKALVAEGRIVVTTYNYENSTPSIRERSVAVQPTWSQANLSWGQVKGSWEDAGKDSAIFAAILDVIGKNNRTDAKHLTSAFNDDCYIFLTSDKDDICTYRDRLEGLLSLRIFHNPTELEDAIAHIRSVTKGIDLP